MIELLTKRLAELFSDDPSVPSVTIAWLGDEKGFYVSLVRYTEAFGQGKKVIAKERAASLEVCVSRLLTSVGVTIGRDDTVQGDAGSDQAVSDLPQVDESAVPTAESDNRG